MGKLRAPPEPLAKPVPTQTPVYSRHTDSFSPRAMQLSRPRTPSHLSSPFADEPPKYFRHRNVVRVVSLVSKLKPPTSDFPSPTGGTYGLGFLVPFCVGSPKNNLFDLETVCACVRRVYVFDASANRNCIDATGSGMGEPLPSPHPRFIKHGPSPSPGKGHVRLNALLGIVHTHTHTDRHTTDAAKERGMLGKGLFRRHTAGSGSCFADSALADVQSKCVLFLSPLFFHAPTLSDICF